jgi:pyruvate,orthophosphate dikinase
VKTHAQVNRTNAAGATQPRHAAGRPKQIYAFGEGNAGMRDLLGGKGANLCEMAQIGIPVPPGFVITTKACLQYYKRGRTLPTGLWAGIRHHVAEIEKATGRRFGAAADPLLVSVRSGSKFSMPGMMDTILNLGLNEETTKGLAEVTRDRRFALDCYRRFIQMFAKVALGLDNEPFEAALDRARQESRVASDAELDAGKLREIVDEFKDLVSREAATPFPEDPWEQLRLAVTAVFESWNNPRAVAYRDFHRIPHDLGTAVNILAMVFGNSGSDSGTGVCFSRDPATGERRLYGEYLSNAQGEDVVSGTRTPKAISELAGDMPGIFGELTRFAQLLEDHFNDVQDIEFTVERGRLFILQTRSANRTVAAAVKTAVDMCAEGSIGREEAVRRVPANKVAQLLLPRFDESSKRASSGRLIGRGLNASPGAATGRAVFDSAAVTGEQSDNLILVRRETSADDMPGILRAAGLLTSRGGITSHAAVVARALGKPAVVGCSALLVDEGKARLSVNGTVVREGDEISIDGATGEVFLGRIETIEPDISANRDLAQVLTWADKYRRMGVLANADTPADARQALAFGAEGIGLCRTEHMFFHPDRLPFVRDVLLRAPEVSAMERRIEQAPADRREAEEDTLARSPAMRAFAAALDRLGDYQAEDFAEILRIMDGKPVVIRLLDAPLHEFLPSPESLQEGTPAARNGGTRERERLLEAALALQETNPMMGHRGTRLGLTYPAVYRMQVRSVLRATAALRREGFEPCPEIMVPLVVAAGELRALRSDLEAMAEEFGERLGRPGIPFGTMIELPRAALAGGRIAPLVDFFSFGSNDLTQMTFGFSRDDAEDKFLSFYLERGFLLDNPFERLDELGVGRLIQIAATEGRGANQALELGLCGEHGGDPDSIRFCQRVGLNYVSCSPMRLPVARLAAAQAALAAD